MKDTTEMQIKSKRGLLEGEDSGMNETRNHAMTEMIMYPVLSCDRRRKA